MNNNYPSAFHSNCIGDIPCNKHNKGCVTNRSKVIRFPKSNHNKYG